MDGWEDGRMHILDGICGQMDGRIPWIDGRWSDPCLQGQAYNLDFFKHHSSVVPCYTLMKLKYIIRNLIIS